MSNYNIVQLADHRPAPDEETVSVLRFLERLASAGRLKDVAIAFELEGETAYALTGNFKDDQVATAAAADFLSLKLTPAASAFKRKKIRN